MLVIQELDNLFGELFEDGNNEYRAYCPICGREYDVTWDETDPRCIECDAPIKEI